MSWPPAATRRVGSDLAPACSGIADGSDRDEGGLCPGGHHERRAGARGHLRRAPGRGDPLRRLDGRGRGRGRLTSRAKVQRHQRAGHCDTSAAGLREAGLQDDVHLHRLCVQRSGRDTLGSGLQGLSAPELSTARPSLAASWPSAARWRSTSSCASPGCSACNGKNFIKTMLQAVRDARYAAGGVRPDRHADLYLDLRPAAGGHDRVRQVRLLPRHQRGRLHLAVRLRLRDLPPGRAARRRCTPVTTAEYGASKAARPFNSRLDEEQARGERLHAAARLEGCPLPRYLKEIAE